MAFQDSALNNLATPPALQGRGLIATERKLPARRRAANTDDESSRYLSVEKLRKQYLDYLTGKIDEIEEQKESRRYYHCAHWSPEAIKILRDRHQPPNTWNRVGRKINGIVGLVERMRSDPKAQPNKPKSEVGADIATEAIRNVLSANDWKALDPECMRHCGIDGVSGVGLSLAKNAKGQIEVEIGQALGDEYFYDPKSIRFDFNDKRYDGIAKWIDLDAAIELFPDKEDLLTDIIENGSDLSTNSDREYKWIVTTTKRLRLVEHWYKYRNRWCWAFYVASTLIDEGMSPYYDEKGQSMSRFIMFSAAVDHDGDRYGFVRNLKGPQDALNQSKSKSLHIANSRRLIMEKGAVDDVEITRREWARPDGVVEKNPGKEIAPDQTTADLAAFTQFSEDAKNEIEQYGNFNVANLSGSVLGNISGRAIELLRQPGMAELGPFILSYRGWKLRVYRGIWNTIQRYWNEERWLRVTDDEDLAQFIQINGLGLDDFGQPVIINALGQLDVDIELEEGPDVASLMQETYDALKGYPPGTFPPQVLIELAPIRRSDKKRILQMMSPPQQPPDPVAELAKRLSVEQLHAQNQDLQADAIKKQAEARKTHAGVDQVEADTLQKRTAALLNTAKAQHLGTTAHLDVGDFALRASKEAREANAPQEGEGGSSAAPASTPAQMPLPPMPSGPPQAYPPPF